MPANLTPEYMEAERRFKAATTSEEKLTALEEMMATIPRHKGTEKMQADLKRRISKLRTEQARKPVSRAGIIHRIDKEGAGQVALVGPPTAASRCWSGSSPMPCQRWLTTLSPPESPYQE